MPEFDEKDEKVNIAPEGSPRPELEKENTMLNANVLEKKMTIEKITEGTPLENIKIERGLDGQIWAYQDEKPVEVKISCCFPWTQPGRYISLRDKDDHEIVLIDSLSLLDTQSREILEQALLEAGFVFEIQKVELSEEEFEIRNWKVQTKQGQRKFQTRLDEWPRKVPGGGLLIRDVAGDLYYVPNPKTLDEMSRKILWAFIDEE